MSATPLIDVQAALGFVQNQTSIIEPGVYATRYPDIIYRDLVPVDTSGSEFATSVTYLSSDQYGRADWINGNSDDIPKAGTTRAQHQTPVHTAGIGYGYGWEEIGRAQMLGVNLPNDDAAAARRAAEEMVERVALYGDPDKGFTGLFDAVPAVAAPNGDWPNATPNEIVADLNAMLMNTFTSTAGTGLADTLLIPWERLFHLSTTPMTSNSDTTILQWFMANNVFTATTGAAVAIRGVRGLDTAGADDGPRAVAYRNDPGVLRLHMPMPHRFLPVFQSGPLRWDVPGVMRLGGLDVRLPNEVSILDGI